MITLTKIGHVNLRVADIQKSKAFHRDVLGFRVPFVDTYRTLCTVPSPELRRTFESSREVAS